MSKRAAVILKAVAVALLWFCHGLTLSAQDLLRPFCGCQHDPEPVRSAAEEIRRQHERRV